MPYNEEVMNADAKYQKEQTVQNELVLEKAKLKFWQDKLKENPSDKELLERIEYHRSEIERLEMEVKIA